MIKQTITYDTFDDPPKEVTEDFYFNLNKLEIMEMEIAFEGGLEAHIKKLTKTEDGPDAYFLFKDIILKSYGKKADDGRGFEKSIELMKQFEESPALGELIFGFLKDGNDAATFVKGILPARLVAEVEKEAAKQDTDATVTQLPSNIVETIPPVPATIERKFQDYTQDELLAMGQAEFQSLVPEKTKDMTKGQLLIAMQRKNG